MRFWLILLSTVSFQAVSANIFDMSLWTADTKLQKEEYSVAVNEYLKIQAKDPRNERLNYNLGIGLYRLGAFDNAAFNFQQSAQQASSPILKEKALYNLGNALFKQEDYENAIKAYEGALQIDPDDEDTKFNLELARKKLEQKNQNQDKSDEHNKDKQDQNKDEQNKDKQEQNKDQQNQDKQEQKKDQQNGQNNQPKKSEPKQRKGNLNEQEVQMLLQQVQEGKPQGAALGLKSKPNSDPKKKTKPW